MLLINKSKRLVRRFELETDSTKICLVLTGIHWIKKICCEELLDSQCSAHDRSLSVTRVIVITDEASLYHQDHEGAFFATLVVTLVKTKKASSFPVYMVLFDLTTPSCSALDWLILALLTH